MSRKYLISLTDSCPEELCGGKAHQLSQLIKWGFFVPGGYCITRHLLRDFIRMNHLEREYRRLKRNFQRGRDVRECLDRLRAGIRRGKFPDDFVLEVGKILLSGKGGRFAFRSSAIAEDSIEKSFAGLFSTELNVEKNIEKVFEAIRKVWLSLFDERVIRYLRQRRTRHFNFEMGIVLQKMLFTRRSGVAFSLHPITHDPAVIYIEESRRSVDHLVSGEDIPEVDVFFKENIETVKNVSFWKIALARQVIKLEQYLGYPVDVEWAMWDDQIFILQARPVTTVKPAGITVWTDENTGEVLPEVVTPLTWDILGPLTNRSFFWLLKRLGARPENRRPLFRPIDGKVYFNHTLFQTTVKSMFPSGVASRQTGGKFLRPFLSVGRLFLRMGNFLFLLVWLPLRSRQVLATVKAVEVPPGPEEEKPARLLDRFLTLVRKEERVMQLHVANTFLGEILFQVVRTLLKWVTLPGVQLHAERLVANIGQVQSAHSGEYLREIAGEMRRLFREKGEIPSELKKFLTVCRTDPQIRRLVNRFLEKYGHMSDQEFELSHPRWAEDPESLLKVLFHLMQSPQLLEGEEGLGNASLHQERDLRFLARKKPLLGSLIYLLVRWTRIFHRNRENLKQRFLHLHFALKQECLAIGEWLERQGLLAERQEVFFLRREEIVQTLEKGAIFPEELKRFRVQPRQKIYWRNRKKSHPRRLIEARGTIHWPVERTTEHRGELRGIPCSAGYVEGSARVIESFAEAEQMKPGEILVTHSANPGWTPLFILASGVVTEIGGALSHSAIIAREYNVPMVAAVPDATTRIRTGDQIAVDGASGLVKILKRGMDRNHEEKKSVVTRQ